MLAFKLKNTLTSTKRLLEIRIELIPNNRLVKNKSGAIKFV
tara:strand:- start:311 stop:433 length:123 start_codon:yes stop_codon:yes gene_type:complete